MYYAQNKERKERNNGRNWTIKLGKNQNAGREGKLHVHGNVASGYSQTKIGERKNK